MARSFFYRRVGIYQGIVVLLILFLLSFVTLKLASNVELSLNQLANFLVLLWGSFAVLGHFKVKVHHWGILVWGMLFFFHGQLQFHNGLKGNTPTQLSQNYTFEGKVVSQGWKNGGNSFFLLALSSQSSTKAFRRNRNIFLLSLPRSQKVSWEKGDKLVVEGVFEMMEKRHVQLFTSSRKNPHYYIKGARVKKLEIFSSYERYIDTFKKRIEKQFKSYHMPKVLKEPLTGILLGRSDRLPKKWKDSFSHMNGYHIFAISGLHFAVMSWVLSLFLGAIGISRSNFVYILCPLLFLYLCAVAFPPSAVRAWLMISLFLIEKKLPFRMSSIHIICMTGLMGLVFCPDWVNHRGFILSYCATFSLFGPGKSIEEYIKKRVSEYQERMPWRNEDPWTHWGGKCLIALAYSTVVWLWTTPLISNWFGTFAPLSILCNLLIVLAMPLLMTSLLLAFALGCFSFLLGKTFSYAAGAILWGISKIVAFFDAYPGAYFEGFYFSWWATVLWYLGLLSLWLLVHLQLQDESVEEMVAKTAST